MYRNSPFYGRSSGDRLEPEEIKRATTSSSSLHSKDDLRERRPRTAGSAGTGARRIGPGAHTGHKRYDRRPVYRPYAARRGRLEGALRAARMDRRTSAGRFVRASANYTLFVGGLSEAVSAEAMGVCVIPAPLATTGLEKLMQIIMAMKPTVLFATPSSTVFLADYVRKQLGIEPVSLGFSKGFMAGEAMPEEDRRKIEEEWGIVARNFYVLPWAADLATNARG